MGYKEATPVKVKNIQFSQEYRIEKDGTLWTPYRGWHKMSPRPTAKGYFRIGLRTIDKKTKMFQLHRLVLETFNPISGCEKMQVNHIDGDKSNNCLENLEWCNGNYNMQHSYDIGIHVPPYGTKAGGNILNEQQVLEICDLIKNSSYSLREIGKKYGVSKGTVYDIKRKKSWAWLTKNISF